MMRDAARRLEDVYEGLKPLTGRTASLARMHVLTAMEHLLAPLPKDARPSLADTLAEERIQAYRYRRLKTEAEALRAETFRTQDS